MSPGPGSGPGRDDAVPRVPAAEELTAVDADGWAELLVHVRRALNDLPDDEVTPELARLRATPTSRLAAGRMRRVLARALARGGPLWRDTHGRLAEAGPSERLEWLVTGEPPVGLGESAPEPAPARPDEELEERLEQARTRLRELRDERDRAVRRADGAEARAETLTDKLAAAEEALAEERRRRAALEEDLDQARERRREAVARERRRQKSRREDLQAELTRHRRREQERARQEQARRGRSAGESHDGPREQPAPSRPLARPGRPSRLPEDVRRETTEGALALLTPGRRVLIDGYNVARTQGPELALEQQRSWIVRLAHRAAIRFDVRPTVVFDGATGVGDYAGIHRGVDVSFSADGVTADDEIVFIVAAAEPEEPVLVVTDDRELRSRVRDRGVDVVGTGPFVSAVR